MYVGENLDFAFSALHCGASRFYHNPPLSGWPTSQSANTMTVTRHDCRAIKAADRNLCMGVKNFDFSFNALHTVVRRSL